MRSLTYFYVRPCAFNGGVTSWDVRSVADMGYMFREAVNFDGCVSAWDTCSVTGMDGMFDGAEAFQTKYDHMPPELWYREGW